LADYSLGASGGDLNDLVARAQAAAQAVQELERKEEERASVEEESNEVDDAAVGIRSSLIAVTRELAAAVSANTSAIVGETAAVDANTSAWQRNAQARAIAEGRALSNTEAASGSAVAGDASVAPVTRRRAPSRPEPVETYVAQDPLANANYDRALRQQAAAESQRASAASAYTSSIRPTSGAAPAEQASLLAQREQATAAVTAARAQTAAAQQIVVVQQQIAQAKAEELAVQQQVNAELTAQRLAQAQATADAQAVAADRAATVVSQAPQLALGAGRAPQLALGAGAAQLQLPRGPLTYLPPASASLATDESTQATTAGTAATTEESAAEREAADQAAAHGRALEALAVQQREANEAVSASAAAYAESSQVLSRNGALTTEFIQAFARGQVTLREFESQMVSTIGKFGGWAVAGGLVYGAYEALKQLGEGATQTQAAVQNVGRFIPGLGGPAGGGTGQVGALESSVRDISTQFNVPIKEVTDSMQVMARTFQSVASAGDATRAVLAVSRLDQVPQAQSEQYLVGIANSTGLTQGSQLLGVVNSLNALQSTTGARVSQTLPGLARAAPAAEAGGLDLATLAALVAQGVRAGIPGLQVGTALLRSVSNFAFEPTSEDTFAQYGITAQVGNYKGLIDSVTGLIDQRSKSGDPLSQTDLHNLAIALGGKLQGPRAVLPILEQEQLHPGALQSRVETYDHPRPYQEDLSAVLGTVDERFKSIGISLENFGSHLDAAGLLQPLVASLGAVHTVLALFLDMITPLTDVLEVFGQLPRPIQDAIGLFVALRGAQALYRSSFGNNAQGFISKLPELGALDSEPRAAIRGTVGRLETYQLPLVSTDEERADAALYRATNGLAAARSDQAAFLRANPDAIDSEGEIADNSAGDVYAQKVAESAAAEQRVGAAAAKVAAASETVAQVKADIATLSATDLTTEQKISYMLSRQLVAQTELTDITETRIAEAKALAGSFPKSGGGALAAAKADAGSGAGLAAVAGGASVAAIVSEALEDASEDPQAISDVEATVTQEAALSGATGASETSAQASAARGAPLRAAEGVSGAPLAAGAVPSVALAGPGVASGAGIAEEEAVGLGGASLFGRAISGSAAITEGAGSLLNRTISATGGLGLSRAGDFLSSGPGGLAALLGTQLAGSTVGGSVGNDISTVGGSAATGLFLGNLLGKGSTNASLAGFAAGTVAGSFQQSTTSGLFAAAGTAIGGGLGTLGGPFDALTIPAGLAIGSVVGNVAGDIFGGSGPSSSSKQASAGSTAVAQGVSGISSYDTSLGNEINTVGTGSASSASTATGTITSQIQQLQAEIDLYGQKSVQGQAAQGELSDTISAAVSVANQNPAAAQQIVSAASSSKNEPAENAFKYDLSQSKPGDELSSLAPLAASYTATNDDYSSAVTDDAEALTTAQQTLTAALAGGNAKVIAAARTMVTSAQSALSGTKSLATTQEQANTLATQADAQSAFTQQTGDIDAAATYSQSAAGADPTKQAQDALAKAQAGLKTTDAYKGKISPDEEYQSVLKYKAEIDDAQEKLVQNTLTTIQTQGSVAQSTIPTGDAVAQAQEVLTNLNQQLAYAQAHAHDFDPNQIADLQKQVNDANTALAAASVTQIDAQSQVTQAQQQGDALQQATTAQAAAREDLSLADGLTQQLSAEKALADANNQYNQALQARITAAGALAASTTNNPVQKVADQISAATKALGAAVGPDAKGSDQTDLNNLKAQYTDALVSQTESTIQFQLDMQTITSQQAINQLNGLLKTKNLSLADQQSIEEQVYKLQNSDTTGSQFDLAPGNIKLPTIFDVATGLRAAYSAQPGAVSPNITAQATTQINVTVNSDADVFKVSDAIDRSVGSNLHSKLKSAGLR
jgi:hypothetical protein